MTAEKKIAHQRLTLLQVAERIRNVSEACRRHGVSRSQFYEYKRAFQERGLDGLIDRLPIPAYSDAIRHLIPIDSATPCPERCDAG